MFMPVRRAGRDGGAARCLRALRVWGSSYGTRNRLRILDAGIEVLEVVRWDCKRAGVVLVSRSSPASLLIPQHSPLGGRAMTRRASAGCISTVLAEGGGARWRQWVAVRCCIGGRRRGGRRRAAVASQEAGGGRRMRPLVKPTGRGRAQWSRGRQRRDGGRWGLEGGRCC